MKKFDQFLNGLLAGGFVDDRKLAGVAHAARLPNGEFGFCLMCLKDNMLNLYDTNIKQEIGELLYSVDLKNITKLKTSTFIFNSYIKFTYEGFNYKLVDCMHKEMYRAIKEETMKISE